MRTLHKLGALCVTLLIAGSMFTTAAEASHFLYGNLSYTSDGSGTVVFTLTAGFERESEFGSCRYSGTHPDDGCVDVGDVISETIGGTGLNFGDGNSTGRLEFEVISIDVDDRFFIAVALEPETTNRNIPHTYSGAGPFNATVNDCCRAGSAELNNRSNNTYNLETEVFPQVDNDSPTTSLDPVVQVNENDDSYTFTIPATDNEGDDLQFRVATNSEAGGGSGTPSFTIDQNTGVVTLDGTALTGSAPFYTEQVIIEELDANGDVRTQTPIDFLLRPEDAIGSPPEVTITPPGPLTVEVGSSVSYTVEGTDPDDDEVTLNITSALPSGASLSTPLPETGTPPVSTTFNWTPTSGQVGSYVFNYSVEDTTGSQDQQSITVDVIEQQGGLLLTSICTDGDGSLFRVRNEGSADADFSADDAAGTFNISGTALADTDQFFYAPDGSTVRLYDADGNEVDVKAHNPASCVDENNPPVCEGEIFPSDQFASFDVASPYRGLEEIEITVTNGTVEVFDENGESTGFSVTDDTDTFDAGEVFGQSYTLNLQGNFNGNVAFFATASGPNGSVECDPRFSNVDQEEPNGTVSFAVHNNAPNPFSESTTLHYDLPEAADVSVEVYDAMGRQVETVALGQQTAGANQQVRLQARDWPAGVYLYRLTATGSTTHVASGQMTLVR